MAEIFVEDYSAVHSFYSTSEGWWVRSKMHLNYNNINVTMFKRGCERNESSCILCSQSVNGEYF